MNKRKKRNIVIGVLCGVLLLMVIGYAAFNTLLNIEGTTSISSNWNIKITGVTSKDKVGEASTVVGYPTYKDLTAEFQTNLVSPGDSISYDITIENKGNLNAELARIKVSENDNEAIKFTTTGLSEGDILEASGKAILTVKVEYSDEVTNQPDNLTADLEVTLDYVQQGHKSEWVPDDETASEMLIKKATTNGDGLYSDTYESGRYVYKGTNPDNYITFNGENAGWRIVSVESDETIKIMKSNLLVKKAFDTKGNRTTGYCSQGSASQNGCNVWAATATYVNNDVSGNVAKDSSLKTYLNETYYNSLTANKTAIQNHEFYYGPVTMSNTNLSTQITSEKKYFINSNIGLIQASDYIKANTEMGLCGNYDLANRNYNSCQSTNWMSPKTSDNYFWTISPIYYSTSASYNTSVVVNIRGDGDLNHYAYDEKFEVRPAIYLKSNTILEGKGTSSNPYKIINYTN